ncbi:MAG: hypothetical protein ACD_42C00283G0002 [uncultured bacterium]|nr:MAG: hypothetical protein ACD_42C00283G0002 [uncultured bacterium]OGT33459.1 MAG: DnaA regulatory inactivator Hda [Gammaproteobacteria bacterium RIFCSPHIGHO2_02_FULL_39_13]OGT49676.1 MAG: DnaA regulatory inactivator Hda [Gammaproteobacteria bacterium RIFCSPHIGHO2_12_FULL_39_24]
MIPHQLPLKLTLRDDALFDNYFVGDNHLLIDAIKKWVLGDREPFIYCYGNSGMGRTHLLQACCHAIQKNNHSVFYLPLSHHAEFSSEIVDALENQDCICIDDLDLVIGNQQWEESLFHFYNRAKENNTRLLVSATIPPQQLNCFLKDLQSRLSWGLVLAIKNLRDEEKIKALQMRANLRGIHLSDEVGNYLIHHYSRNMRDLFSILEILDHASLAEQRKLTVPFVKRVLPCATVKTDGENANEYQYQSH